MSLVPFKLLFAEMSTMLKSEQRSDYIACRVAEPRIVHHVTSRFDAVINIDNV